MLSRALRRSLALEVALYVALAIYGCDASPAAAAGVALAGVLALRATLTAVVTDDAAAEALGVHAAELLLARGARDYLAASGAPDAYG